MPEYRIHSVITLFQPMQYAVHRCLHVEELEAVVRRVPVLATLNLAAFRYDWWNFSGHDLGLCEKLNSDSNARLQWSRWSGQNKKSMIGLKMRP